MTALSIPKPLSRFARRGIPFPRLAIPRPLSAFLTNLASKAGHLVRTTSAPYNLATGCGDDDGPAPSGCTWPTGLAATYTVTGWSGLAACPLCDASSAPAWPGTVYHVGAGCVWWAIDTDYDPFSINGVSLDIAYTQILLRTSVTPARWELYIACSSTTHPTQTMWYGYKTTGSTPAGAYTLVGSDCSNTRPTMTVTE